MADSIIDVIHRFSYEITGQDKVAAIEKQFQRNAAEIAKQTASLQRLQNALNNTSDPAKQERLRQAIENRTAAINAQGQAIQNTIINDRQFQAALQSEIGVLNELSRRLDALRQARQRATSAQEIANYNRQIQAVQQQQASLTAAPAPRLSISMATPTANSNVLASPATASSVNAVRGLSNESLVQYQRNLSNIDNQIALVQRQQQSFLATGSRVGAIGRSLLQGIGAGVGLGAVQILGNAVGAIKNLAKESFMAAANFDQLRVAFTTLLQSAPKANQLLSDITKFAADTPFGTEQLTELSKQLIAFGFNAEEIIPTLNAVGNIAAGVGTDKLPQIVLALGQIRSAGKLTGQDLLQLINAGFNPLQEISQRTGVSYGKLKDEMEKGRITFAMVKESFRAATSEGGKFFNLMQSQSKTVAGQIDRLGDSVDLFKRNLGSVFQDVGADFLGFLGDVVDGFNEWIALDPAAEVRKEQIELNTLVNTLIEVNNSSTARSELIAKLQTQYPDFLGNISQEQITTGFLASRLADVNAQYQRRIELIGLTVVREGILEKRRANAGAQVNAATVRGALSSVGIEKELSQVTSSDISSLSEIDRRALRNTLRSAGLLSGTQTIFGDLLESSKYVNALKEADKLEREALQTNEGIDKAYMAAEKRENEAKEAGKAANAAQLQRYKDELAGAKVAQQNLKRLVDSGKATLGQLSEYDDIAGRIQDLNNLIAVKGLEGQPTSTGDTTPYTPEKKTGGSRAKPKTAEQLADEAYKKATELIETEIGNQKLTDKRLKELQELRLRNERAYTAYVNSDTFRTDSKDQRDIRQNQYKGIQQSLASQIQQIDLTFDVAEIELKIDAATKLKRKEEIIKLSEERIKKELDLAQIRIELPIDLNIDPKAESDWAMRSQKAFNEEEQKRLKKQKEEEERILEERKQAYQDMYQSILANASIAIDSIYGKQIQTWDKEIEYRQYTVEQARTLAERGNTEELATQERYLREAMANREEAAQRQIQLNALLQASNMAVALSEAIGAIVSAAKGDPYTLAARVIAAAAALVGGIAAVTSAFGAANSGAGGFAEGGYTGDGGKYQPAGTVHKGEFVFTKEATKRIGVPNLEKMMAGQMPLASYYPVMPKNYNGEGYATTKEIKGLKSELLGIKQAIYDTQIKAENKMDGNGVTQLIEKHVKQDQRRFKR